MALSCKDQGKQLSVQYYSRPNVSILEIRNPETVINLILGLAGEILSPKVYSPKVQFNHALRISAPKREALFHVLNGLVTAEKVARRQYDELLMFPEMQGFENDLLYIRNDEHEHEKILECIIQRLSNPTLSQGNISLNYLQEEHLRQANIRKATAKGIPIAITLTKQDIGEVYETILERFSEEEEKAVRSYEEFLVKVQQSKAALEESGLPDAKYFEILTPLNQLEQKINKHLNEERVHLDVVDALAEMFGNMKLGKVY